MAHSNFTTNSLLKTLRARALRRSFSLLLGILASGCFRLPYLQDAGQLKTANDASSKFADYQKTSAAGYQTMLANQKTLEDAFEIVSRQGSFLPYAIPQFIGLIVFFFAGIAETSRAPFDLPEAEQELVAGYHTEYSGMRWGLFQTAEYINLITLSGLMVTLFFSGWHGPWNLGPLWFLLKLFGILFVWEIIPEWIFPVLQGVSIFCLAKQNSLLFTNLFGGSSGNEGLGFLSVSFDWQYIASLGSPMWLPLYTLTNSTIGYFLRPGAHDVTLEDWQAMIAFADKHLKK